HGSCAQVPHRNLRATPVPACRRRVAHLCADQRRLHVGEPKGRLTTAATSAPRGGAARPLPAALVSLPGDRPGPAAVQRVERAAREDRERRGGQRGLDRRTEGGQPTAAAPATADAGG